MMLKTIRKWLRRCLGWIAIALVLLAWVAWAVVDRAEGYGRLAVALSWNGQAYLPPDAAAATLLVRGERHPLAPGQPLTLRPGPAAAELDLAGFLPARSTALVMKNQSVKLDFALQAAPRRITLRNRLPGATLDGQPIGDTWTTQAEVGRVYSFVATAPGCETNRLELRINRPGQDLVADLALAPLLGGLKIQPAPAEGTEVFVDGKQVDDLASLAVKAGSHLVTASNADFFPFSATVEVYHHTTNTLPVPLRPRPATITLNLTPPVPCEVTDAKGAILPLEGAELHSPPGAVRLKLHARGFAPIEQKFRLEANHPYVWTATLEREGAAEFKRASGQYQRLATSPEFATALGKLGGSDWAKLRRTDFDAEDLIRGAKQYTDACATLAAIQATLPERGRAWTNEVRVANAIDFWLVTGELDKAAAEIDRYASRFGGQSDFAQWFGPPAGKIQGWRDALETKRLYLPAAPGAGRKTR